MKKSERLQKARISAGYATGAKAARALGIGIPTYNSHENATRDFSNEYALKYAAHFDVPVEWLVFGIETAGGAARNEKSETSFSLEEIETLIRTVETFVAREQWEFEPENRARLYSVILQTHKKGFPVDGGILNTAATAIKNA